VWVEPTDDRATHDETDTGIGVDLVHVAVVCSYHEVRAEGANQEAALANPTLTLGKDIPKKR
jgi:hypothetical protein